MIYTLKKTSFVWPYATCLSLFLFFTSFIYAQDDSLSKRIQKIIHDKDAVGIAVVVVKENSIVYNNNFGYSNLELNYPLQQNTLFRIASISKTFTATAIMQLIDANKIHLDDDVSNLLGFKVRNPKYPDQAILLRHLLSHRSSIHDTEGYYTLDVIDSSRNTKWRNAYSNSSPGSQFIYSNLNYNMLGAIIEKISGKRYDKYIIENILHPLGIEGGYDVSELDLDRFAQIYTYDAKSLRYNKSKEAYQFKPSLSTGYVVGRSAPLLSPTGGLKISALGLARYMTMHMQGGEYNGIKILNRTSEEMMQTLTGDLPGYGMGFRINNKLIDGEIIIGHTGSAYGFYGAMFFHPQKKIGFVVLVNGCRQEYEDGYNFVIRNVVNGIRENYFKNLD
jgi:CubicO group peptidase (beta-lactamase class C family)